MNNIGAKLLHYITLIIIACMTIRHHIPMATYIDFDLLFQRHLQSTMLHKKDV